MSSAELIARLEAEIATLEWHIKGCENEMHAWAIGCPYCKRDERLESLLRDAAHALSGATPAELSGLIAFYEATQREDATIDGRPIADDYRLFFKRTLDVLRGLTPRVPHRTGAGEMSAYDDVIRLIRDMKRGTIARRPSEVKEVEIIQKTLNVVLYEVEALKAMGREASVSPPSEGWQPAIYSQQVITWLRAYASGFLVHNLIHGDIIRVADHLEGRLPAPPASAGTEEP